LMVALRGLGAGLDEVRDILAKRAGPRTDT